MQITAHINFLISIEKRRCPLSDSVGFSDTIHKRGVEQLEAQQAERAERIADAEKAGIDY